jgi:hypothetical protein
MQTTDKIDIAQKELVLRKELPRLHAFLRLIKDPGASNAYSWPALVKFCTESKSYETPTDLTQRQLIFRDIETVLQELDVKAWETFREDARPYLAKKDELHGRGWQQLYDRITEACAYRYLKSLGCSNIEFIPRSKKNGQKTPELKAVLNSAKVLCEAKTINISDVEARRRKTCFPVAQTYELLPEFFTKLESDLERAKNQLGNYDKDTEAIHLVFVAVQFDNFFESRKKENCQNCQLIRQYLESSIPGIEIGFQGGMGAYHISFTARLPN